MQEEMHQLKRKTIQFIRTCHVDVEYQQTHKIDVDSRKSGQTLQVDRESKQCG